MPILRIDGVPPFDGDYEFDTTFTNQELHLIKQETGVRAGELVEALLAGDTDLVVAIAAILLRRSGKGDPRTTLPLLWEATVGLITLDFSKEIAEDDALPPANGPADETDNDGGKQTSGPHSEGDSAIRQNGQSRTGHQRSDTGSTSAPVTSAT